MRGTPIIVNTILWGDSPDEISADYYGAPRVTYSDIQGGRKGEGNIDADPLFVDPQDNDFHLQYMSPCIDRGTDEGAPEFDFEGDDKREGLLNVQSIQTRAQRIAVFMR